MAKSKAVASSGEMLQLDPAVILADDNSRFGLKESRVQSLAKSILERGEVLEPIEVELLPTADNGHTHRLTTGFYRLAAVTWLNATQAAGLTIPAIVRAAPDAKERLRRQLAENMERENQSPMDQAVAIKRLLDSGLSKIEVREIYSRPGGRKGNKVQPASNSFINMTLSFLELPKAIQNKIHEGLVGVAAAYELTKVPAEQRQKVLEAAEAQRQRDLEREERDEERILAQEKKAGEAQAKRDAMQKEVTEASEKAKAAHQAFEEAGKRAGEAYQVAKQKHPDAKTKKAAESAFKKAEQDRKVAEADAVAAQKDYETLQVKFTKHETLAAERAQKLREARSKAPAGATKKGDAVGPTDVKKAAASTGASSNWVPLNKAEITKVVNELCLPGGSPKVIAIGQAFVRCFAGEITDKALYKELVGIVG